MDAKEEGPRAWAKRVFGRAELGDARRTRRLVELASTGATRPGGKVTDVCRTSAERQGAYDLLSSSAFDAASIRAAVFASSAHAAAEVEWVFVAVDGTSLSLTDRAGEKDFGPIGARAKGARGLKVVNALAIDSDGAAVGLVHQRWWARADEAEAGGESAPPRESEHWIRAVEGSGLLLAGAGAKAWFQLDREGDNARILRALAATGHEFTVRSAHRNRVLLDAGRRRLRHAVSAGKVRYRTVVQIRRNEHGRRAREARVTVRTTTVRLALGGSGPGLEVGVVDVREDRKPRGQDRVHWRLLTNHGLETNRQVQEVIHGYQQRWRVEELHKTWKTGACRVEETQLRRAESVVKWATIMAAAASRIERLKHLHRKEPERPASDEFSEWEIEAAVLLRRRYKKRTDPTPAKDVTAGEMIGWVADFGGYTGKSSGGPPGAIVLRRGMEMLLPAAMALEELACLKKM